MDEELDDIIDDIIDDPSIQDLFPEQVTTFDDDDDDFKPSNEDSDKSKSEETRLGSHTSGKCNLCGCTHFRPSSDGKYCLCGHSDYNHEWI